MKATSLATRAPVDWLRCGAALVAVSAGLTLFAPGCSRENSTDRAAQTPRKEAPPAPGSPHALATSLAPKVGGPPGYTGSAACQECHPEEFGSWHRSYHRTMTQLPSAAGVRADFNHVTLTNENTRFTLTRTNDAHWVRMERVLPGDNGQATSASLDTPISLVTGSHHMQVFWVPSGDGNVQIGFPFTWLIPEQRWVPRKSTFLRPPDAPHLSEIWNFSCSRCHTTAVEPRIDPVRRAADTRVAELGISCEACHGPGERHVQARLAAHDQTEVAPEVLEKEIVHPQKIDPVRASQICGFCHSMKWFDHSENWRQTGFRYRPGDDLEQTTPIIRPSRVADVPELARYLERHPDLLQDFFWSDGMVRVSGRDYNGLLESPCYKGGQFSCLSCHSLHRSDPDQQLARNRSGDGACTQCHSEFTDDSTRLAHTRHAANSAGSECYNCHMPRTTYGVLKAIRSHQISSPRVADQLATGRPNACNLCHLDKTLAWTADHLTRWFGHPAPSLSPQETNVADGLRLALSGDAGQRALLAWHLGWEPARQASAGPSWIPPVLAQLLDDPYAAVRCIAERALKAASEVVPPGYDFSQEPFRREPVAGAVVQRWLEATPQEALRDDLPIGAPLGNAAGMQALFDQLRLQRDNRAVRLRE